jgi:hypothetical protein
MKKIILVMALFIFLEGRSFSQGCSDAGVCTIHSIKNNTGTGDDDKDNEISVGFAFGKGERDISYYTPYFEYTRSLTSRTSLTAKASFAFISGELANTSGLSDLFVSVNHAFDTKGKWQKSFIAGLKVPLDRSDIIKDGKHLPMPYQTSLGTTDLVLGINYIRNAFGITLAVQQPLRSINGNNFLPENYPANSLAQKYLPTNEFSRKGDALLRFSYNYNLAEKLSVRPSLLGIYHLANDTYLDVNKIRMNIPNSNGLTLNGNLFLDYTFNNRNSLELSVGAPFIIREKRPDGLTRSVVASIEYRFSF